MAKFLLTFLAGLLVVAFPQEGRSQETFLNPMASSHVYQNDFSKLGLAGLIYCGPAAVTESLAFLKWTRKPNFSRLKWPGEGPMGPTAATDDYLYAQTKALVPIMKTTPWLFPFFDPHYTDSANLVEGLRAYFRDSGYPNPQITARGFEAPDNKPVTLDEIREYTRKGYGVILLIGYYNRWGAGKHRNGGHYLTVFGYSSDNEFIVTDSLRTADKQPRTIQLTPIVKDPQRHYPEYAGFMVDHDDSVYLDAAIFFIPEL